jgi:hypothetical protein
VAPTGRLFEYKLQNGLIGLEHPRSTSGLNSPAAGQDASNCRAPNRENLATLVLDYSKKELKSYTEFRIAGISKASVPWLKRCSLTFWNATKGVINKERCDALRQHLSARYTDVYARRKVLNFAAAFLKYLTKTHFDARYQAFDLFLKMPKGLKTRKHVTSRIITKEDVENVLSAIQTAYQNNEIDWDHYLHFKAIVLFSAFTGQRPQATTARLTVGQFRAAVRHKNPVIDVLSEQDKIRMQHYCPLHPQVVDAVRLLLDGPRNDEPMFKQLSFERWLEAAEDPAFTLRCPFRARRSAQIL